MSLALMVLAALCLAYFLVLLVGAGVRSGFIWFWAAAGAVLAALAWAQHRHPLPPAFWAVLAVFAAVGLLLFGGTVLRILGHYRDRGEPGLDAVLVLGAQVKGDRLSRALRYRLDAALAYWRDNPGTAVVVSGGQGTGETATEAEVMARYLRSQGVPEERILREERSTSTRENLMFSRQLLPPGCRRVGIVTSSFHLYRALKTAEKLLPDVRVCGIAARSERIPQVHYLLREFLAVCKYRITGIL